MEEWVSSCRRRHTDLSQLFQFFSFLNNQLFTWSPDLQYWGCFDAFNSVVLKTKGKYHWVNKTTKDCRFSLGGILSNYLDIFDSCYYLDDLFLPRFYRHYFHEMGRGRGRAKFDIIHHQKGVILRRRYSIRGIVHKWILTTSYTMCVIVFEHYIPEFWTYLGIPE